MQLERKTELLHTAREQLHSTQLGVKQSTAALERLVQVT